MHVEAQTRRVLLLRVWIQHRDEKRDDSRSVGFRFFFLLFFLSEVHTSECEGAYRAVRFRGKKIKKIDFRQKLIKIIKCTT
jgi:hypothetical protein